MTDRWFPDSMPPPMVDHHSLPFWEEAAEHKLTVQRCDNCKHCMLPPAPVCSECQHMQFHQQEVSGMGTVYSFTIVHRPVSFEQELPFVIAVIELDMGGVENSNSVRIMSNIVEADLEKLDIGQSVAVAWEKMSDTVSIPRFKVVA